MGKKKNMGDLEDPVGELKVPLRIRMEVISHLFFIFLY